MNLIILEIPDEPTERTRFLEQKIASPDLSQLIDELNVARTAAGLKQEATAPSLDQFLGQQRQQVLEQGLGGLTEAQTQLLLRHPQLMWDLQELILDEGSDYWLELLNQGVTRTPFPVEITGSAKIPPTTATSVTTDKTKSVSSGFRAWGAVLGTLAALLMVMVGYQYLSTPAGPTWGFSQVGVFEQSLDGPAYLNHLADTAGAWFNKRPDSKVSLAKRLGEFRIGCTQLLAAQHTQLSPEDRDWLIERCQKWIGKIDGHLADLQADQKTFTVIHQEADTTIESLQKTLREHARELAA